MKFLIFVKKNNIDILNMDATFLTQGISHCKTHEVTNVHHYQVELFHVVIGIQLQELNICFTEANT